jgi:NAD-dependent SIR2 family protein deacetylase
MMTSVDLAKDILQKADSILITAGAGMGVDSGLPDFRGDEGFWRAYPPLKDLGISFSQMANPSWFDTDPTLAWAFYGHRLALYRETVPHRGFNILLDYVQNKKNSDYFIYTSNVDGQFQKAGFDDQKIMECHGSIHHLQCSQNCTEEIYSANSTEVEIDMESFKAKDIPLCPNCGAVARPNILMFGDWSWCSDRTSVQDVRFEAWLSSVVSSDKSLAIIEIGAGEAVPTIRYLGEDIASRYKNATLIRINPRDTNIDINNGISIPMGGLEGIESII